MASATASSLVSVATGYGYDALSDRDQKECLLVLATAADTSAQAGSTAKALAVVAASLFYGALSTRDIRLALIGFFTQTNPTTAKSAVVTAAQNRYGAYSDVGLEELLLKVFSGATSTDYTKLSRRGISECELGSTFGPATTAQALTINASAMGAPALSLRDIQECLLAAIE